MEESTLVMIARIDENVISMKKTMQDQKEALNSHIIKDEELSKEYLLPLWEKHQQDIGAQKTRNFGGAMIGYCINACIAAATAWAALKAMK